MPDDKWVAVPVASLRGAVSAGPGRDTRKAEARWVPSRWQLADCLTKKGLSAVFRERMSKASTRLHELSLQHVKRNKDARKTPTSTNYTWLCSFDTDTTKQTPKQVVDPLVGCNFDSHISGGPHSSKHCSLPKISVGNFCHRGTPTRLVAQLTFLKGLKKRLLAQWKIFKDKMPPPAKAASSSSQAASSSAVRSSSPVIRVLRTEDEIAITLAEDESAAEANLQAETKDAMINEIKRRLDEQIKIEEDEDDDIRKEHLKRVLQMDPNFVTQTVQEKEDELLDFVSYNSKVDKDHVYWLPHDLMLYALRTDRELRAVFKDSYVEMENEIDQHGEQEYLVKLFAMDEYTYKSKLVKMLWVGTILNSPGESNQRSGRDRFPRNYSCLRTSVLSTSTVGDVQRTKARPSSQARN